MDTKEYTLDEDELNRVKSFIRGGDPIYRDSVYGRVLVGYELRCSPVVAQAITILIEHIQQLKQEVEELKEKLGQDTETKM